MTNTSHITHIEFELDGFHQSLAIYRQQMNAWYSRALDSVSHAADMPSLLGMDRVLRVGDSQQSVSMSDADFSSVARCPVGGELKIESQFESAYDVPIGEIQPGKRRYLSLEGIVPNNKTSPSGRKMGRTQSEYNEATHFNKREPNK